MIAFWPNKLNSAWYVACQNISQIDITKKLRPFQAMIHFLTYGLESCFMEVALDPGVISRGLPRLVYYLPSFRCLPVPGVTFPGPPVSWAVGHPARNDKSTLLKGALLQPCELI